MEGLALGLETIASSGSTINANELLAKWSERKSGSSIHVHNRSLKAKASSSIEYNNMPQSIEKKI
jgi:hypothetical protein